MKNQSVSAGSSFRKLDEGVCLPRVEGGDVVFRLKFSDVFFNPVSVWSPSPSRSHRVKAYALPKNLIVGARPTREGGARFSPPPFAVVFQNGPKRLLAAVGARDGWHRWNMAEFKASSNSVKIRLRIEKGDASRELCANIRLLLVDAYGRGNNYELLSMGMRELYPAAFAPLVRQMPDWWIKTIYCGWGDQVAAALFMEGPGREQRARAYCIQGLYERWTDNLARQGIPVGTVIVDAGWSRDGLLFPEKDRWPDMKGFIKGQHKKGRRVLLWLPAWEHEGLPDKWCIKAGGRKLSADPANPSYRAFLRKQVSRLLSPGRDGFDADGFKVDKLGFDPGRVVPPAGYDFRRGSVMARLPAGAEIRGKARGCELLYTLQKEIYAAAKKAKPDALITSSTVHPYFHDTFDMVRLHDTGGAGGDIVKGMKARADLARSVLPNHPVDTDNWVLGNYGKWLEYTLKSCGLGVPCIFYSEMFVVSMDGKPAVRTIPASDLRSIGKKWLGAGF